MKRVLRAMFPLHATMLITKSSRYCPPTTSIFLLPLCSTQNPPDTTYLSHPSYLLSFFFLTPLCSTQNLQVWTHLSHPSYLHLLFFLSLPPCSSQNLPHFLIVVSYSKNSQQNTHTTTSHSCADRKIAPCRVNSRTPMVWCDCRCRGAAIQLTWGVKLRFDTLAVPPPRLPLNPLIVASSASVLLS